MSKAEIIAEIPKLSREDREEIALMLAEIDGDGWSDKDDPLSEGDKSLIDERMKAHEKSPESAIPWEEFDAQLRRRLKE